MSVRRAEFSSEQPLSELLRRQRKEEPLRELSTRQRSDEVFRSELLSARKDSRRAEPLPSASDYSDLESPERETGGSNICGKPEKNWSIQRCSPVHSPLMWDEWFHICLSLT